MNMKVNESATRNVTFCIAANRPGNELFMLATMMLANSPCSIAAYVLG